MGALSKIVKFSNSYPISRGIAAYTLIFPTSCLIQQTIDGQKWDTFDWNKVFRFWLYGTFFLAPVGYGYVRLMTKWLPKSDFKTNIKRIIIDQTTYSPIMTFSFFAGMAMMEGKGVEGARQQIEQKFLTTYKTGLCYWPIIQTINFTYITEKNRVPFISMCGMIWTVFLAFMLEKKVRKNEIS